MKTAGWHDGIILVGLCGRRGAGKDAFAKFLSEFGYHRIAFADKLKEAAGRMFGLNRDQLHGTVEQKETPDPRWTTPEHPEGLTPRFILQRLGTEVCRAIHQDVWTQSLLTDVSYQCQGLAPGVSLKFAVTDVRFPNEADILRKHGATIVKLVRTGYAVDPSVDAHDSERLVDTISPDMEFTIASGDMEAMQRAATEVARCAETPR